MCRCTESCGAGTVGSSDGAHDTAQFSYPSGLCLLSDLNLLLCVDTNNFRIRRIDLSDGSVSTSAGSGQRGFINGSCQTAAFYYPYSICPHPLKSGCFWIGDICSVRYCDGQSVSAVAGGERRGYADGVGEAAKFFVVAGLICTANAKTLYVSDSNNSRIRTIEVSTGSVRSVCGDGEGGFAPDGVGLSASIDYPNEICFDRSASVKPESIIYMATHTGILRFDIETGTNSFVSVHCTRRSDRSLFLHCTAGVVNLPVLKNYSSDDWEPHALSCTTKGFLIVANSRRHNICVVNLASGEVEKIAVKLAAPMAVAPHESQRCVYVTTNENNQIKRIDLSDRYF